jgi:hypothetical protein
VKFNKKTIAVSTAALTIVGGVSFAYVLTTVDANNSGGTATTSNATHQVKLTIEDAGTLPDFDTSPAYVVPLKGDNATLSTLRLTTAPTIAVQSGGTCPVASFGTPTLYKVTDPNASGTAWSVSATDPLNVPPNSSHTPSATTLVGYVKIPFNHDISDATGPVDQSGCSAASISFSIS